MYVVQCVCCVCSVCVCSVYVVFVCSVCVCAVGIYAVCVLYVQCVYAMYMCTGVYLWKVEVWSSDVFLNYSLLCLLRQFLIKLRACNFSQVVWPECSV